MGLDISAYKQLAVVPNPELDEDGYPVNDDQEWIPGESMVWSETHFPGRGEGIDAKTVYSYADTLSFRAGSYSGYNTWRRTLEQFKGEVAFQELIDFADNEGVIGYVVAKKLANDFVQYETEAKTYTASLGEYGQYWFGLYQEWKDAMIFASDNGAVEFR